MPTINPHILKWARETAGLSLQDAARLIGLKDSTKASAVDKLLALESGQTIPNRRQLEIMSQKYHRSLLVFYLSEPPIKGDRGQDFRKLPDSSIDSPFLDTLIRNFRTRQSLVKSLLEDEEAEPLEFIGSANINANAKIVAEDIKTTLGFSLDEFRACRSDSDAFTYLRQRIESKGIFVLLAGDLGSHHTAISPQNFRGFAIADPIAPFVIVNNRDATIAWAFTALHEVAHLWLGETGISALPNDLRTERFCNEVAGQILLPPDELNELRGIEYRTIDEAVSLISEFARARNISRAMVAFSLLHSQRVNQLTWRKLVDRFNLEWEESKQKKKDQGGPNYYIVRRHRIGPALMNLVSRSMREGALSPTKAAKILDVKPRKVGSLLSLA